MKRIWHLNNRYTKNPNEYDKVRINSWFERMKESVRNGKSLQQNPKEFVWIKEIENNSKKFDIIRNNIQSPKEYERIWKKSKSREFPKYYEENVKRMSKNTRYLIWDNSTKFWRDRKESGRIFKNPRIYKWIPENMEESGWIRKNPKKSDRIRKNPSESERI